MMIDIIPWLLGITFIFSSILLVLWQKNRRNIILRRFQTHHRKYSGSKTTPCSLSLDENRLDIAPTYLDTFPPCRRIDVQLESGSLPTKLVASNLMDVKKLLPLDMSYLDAEDSLYTPCGFSIKEVKFLREFPDYATLSGVRLPEPYLAFDIMKALPRPYRPFRWAYHQTMSLTKMEPDWWLELENTYVERIKQRQKLFVEHGEDILQALPGSELACRELMEMVLQFLCARYPKYFRLDIDNRTFHNNILHSETALESMHPLRVLLNNVPEDFAIMMRDEKTGFYLFRAGIICSALGWNLGTKIGKRLHEIHDPVPDYKDKMQFSMDRYFAKMPTDKPIQRGSWGIEIGQPLYMPPSAPHKKQRGHQQQDLKLSQCHLRVDWQTLRRLPLSGAVVFNFKALFTPVEEFRNEPYIPRLFLKIMYDAKGSLLNYKNTWHTEHVIKPALERFHREQVSDGLVPEDWEPQTLDESPWFPGWEDKWHSQQGF